MKSAAGRREAFAASGDRGQAFDLGRASRPIVSLRSTRLRGEAVPATDLSTEGGVWTRLRLPVEARCVP